MAKTRLASASGMIPPNALGAAGWPGAETICEDGPGALDGLPDQMRMEVEPDIRQGTTTSPGNLATAIPQQRIGKASAAARVTPKPWQDAIMSASIRVEGLSHEVH